MPRYYIAVPTKIEKFSYQTIFTWTNYSFTGSYEECIVKAIELFREEGYFKNLIDDICNYYGEEDNIEISDILDALQNDDYETMWENAPNYFKDYFDFVSDDFNKGIIEWDKFDNEYMKNWHEDKVHVIELNV